MKGKVLTDQPILRQYLDTVKRYYSHILIDCQPSLGMLTVNALAAANRVLIPVQTEYLPAKGLEQLLQTIGKVWRQINPKLQTIELEGRTATKEEQEVLSRYVGWAVWQTPLTRIINPGRMNIWNCRRSVSGRVRFRQGIHLKRSLHKPYGHLRCL